MYLFSSLQNDLYFTKKSNSKYRDEKQSLMTKINELTLFNDRSEKESFKTGAIKSCLYIILKSNTFMLIVEKILNIPNYKGKKVTIITVQIISSVIVYYRLSVF